MFGDQWCRLGDALRITMHDPFQVLEDPVEIDVRPATWIGGEESVQLCLVRASGHGISILPMLRVWSDSLKANS